MFKRKNSHKTPEAVMLDIGREAQRIGGFSSEAMHREAVEYCGEIAIAASRGERIPTDFAFNLGALVAPLEDDIRIMNEHAEEVAQEMIDNLRGRA
jgi:hypothetical protein